MLFLKMITASTDSNSPMLYTKKTQWEPNATSFHKLWLFINLFPRQRTAIEISIPLFIGVIRCWCSSLTSRDNLSNQSSSIGDFTPSITIKHGIFFFWTYVFSGMWLKVNLKSFGLGPKNMKCLIPRLPRKGIANCVHATLQEIQAFLYSRHISSFHLITVIEWKCHRPQRLKFGSSQTWVKAGAVKSFRQLRHVKYELGKTKETR